MGNDYRKFLKEFYDDIYMVGPKTIDKIQSEITSFDEFIRKGEAQIRQVDALSSEQASKTIELRELLEEDKEVKENTLILMVLDFLNRQIENMEDRASIGDLNVNPFMVNAVNFRDHEKIIEFYLYQSVGRGVVTSMGTEFEIWAELFGLDDTNQDGFDCEVQRDGTTYFVQVKSGPDVLNKDMLENLESNFKKAEEENPGCECLLGLCYGKESEVSGKIRRYLPGGMDNLLIGREFWKFVAEEEDASDNIMQVVQNTAPKFDEYIEIVSDEVSAEGDDFYQALEKRKNSLIEEWEERYGTGRGSIHEMTEDQAS